MQQETGAFRRQKSGLFYLKFSAEFNELSPNLELLKRKWSGKD